MCRIKARISLIMILFLLAVSITEVRAANEVSTEQTFETGIVDIELDEYMSGDDGELLPYKDPEYLLPGSKVSLIPVVKNYGCDCYIRAFITFDENTKGNEDSHGDEAEWISGFDDDWYYNESDGFWYCTKVLPGSSGTAGQECSKALFNEISVPSDLSAGYENSKLELNINVDAVQASNFRPEFGSETPWGSILIEDCIYEKGYTIRKAVPIKDVFSVRYEGGADKLFAAPEDFFIRLPALMPGDTYSDSAELTNNSSDTVDLWFRTRTEDKNDILDKTELTLTVTSNGTEKQYFSGSLRSSELESPGLLCELPANSGAVLKYTIKVPAELRNEYSLNKSSVEWIFSTSKAVQPAVTPRTGDEANAMIWLSAIAAAAVVLITLICTVKKGGDNA